jgi:hypothetical protein
MWEKIGASGASLIFFKKNGIFSLFIKKNGNSSLDILKQIILNGATLLYDK